MIVLLDFSSIKPDVGLFFWTCVIFILFWYFIGKMSFGSIARALRKREDDIQDALDEAKRAREEMSNLRAENEKLLNLAREERTKMLQEAKETKNAIISEAKNKAKEEAQKIVISAKIEIENQKKAALIGVKNQVGNMALDIAEKVLKKQLAGNKDQEEFVGKLVDDLNLN